MRNFRNLPVITREDKAQKLEDFRLLLDAKLKEYFEVFDNNKHDTCIVVADYKNVHFELYLDNKLDGYAENTYEDAMRVKHYISDSYYDSINEVSVKYDTHSDIMDYFEENYEYYLTFGEMPW